MSTSASDHDVMSDTSSSGASYIKYSPYNSPSQQIPQLTNELTELTCADNKTRFLLNATKPFLRIIEQPQNHFRFRYVSEMIGTHGCLLGKSYGINKTKTHPTVELVNYQGPALIRCQLAQHNNPEEHPHKLLDDDQDKDVSQLVPEQGSYKVAFGGIGIIHTAKKDVPGLLFKKFMERNRQPVNVKDVRARCENMARTINLNIVRLKFTAHDIHTGEEICEPAFSEPIHNMKSAATNDLKICRISRSSGSVAGNEDVFILVEKVNKKNIEVRFFELDENGERRWSATARFSQNDVHHQYAIVFSTPPYQDRETPVDVKVYIELVRPSDGRTSEPKEFKYKAEPVYKQIKKRKANSSHCSLDGSSSSGSLKSNCDIPISVVNHVMEHERDIPAVPTPFSMYSMQQQYTGSPNNCDLESALASSESSQSPVSSPMWGGTVTALPVGEPSITDLQLNSADFELNDNLMNTDTANSILSEGMTQFFSVYLKSYEREFSKELNPNMNLDSIDFRPLEKIVADSGRATFIKQEKRSPDRDPARNKENAYPTQKEIKPADNVKCEYNAFYKTEDGTEVKKLVKDLCEMIRDKKGSKSEVRSRLERLFNIRLSNGDTFLHMSLCSGQPSLGYIVKVIHTVGATHLLDCVNDKQQTILHLAVLHDLPKTVALLVSKGANPMLKDIDELNAIHYCVKYKTCLEPLLEAIQKNKVTCNLDDYNGVKQSALHMAVIAGSAKDVRLLLRHGAKTSVRNEYGRTPLHLAAYNDRLDITNILLDYIPQEEIDLMDDSGNTALQIVCGVEIRDNTIDIARLLLEKKANPMKKEEGKESAWRLVRDKPALKELLLKYVVHEIMDEDDIKSEPEDDYESCDEGEAGDQSLQELSAYVREVGAVLDASGGWRRLAQRLHLDTLQDWYAAQPSPTLTLLNHLKDSRDDVTSRSLALILENMGEKQAAGIIRNYIE